MMPRRIGMRAVALFWGTPIEAVSGRLFRFYGVTFGRIGIGVLTHPARLRESQHGG